MTVEHHADFAVPITHQVWMETAVEHPDVEGMTIRGFAIALGWWVDPGQVNTGESIGTLYLIVDERGGPPRWIAEGNIVASKLTTQPGS